MVITYLLFLLGIVFLIKGADWIVDGSSSIAKKWGVSNLIIGLTIVAFGTSLPELVVNLFAAFQGSGEIAFGNVIGSNIANTLFVLGVIACMKNIELKRRTIWNEIPFALLVSFALFVLTGNLFSAKDIFTRDDGLILLGLFGFFLYYIFMMARRERKEFSVSAVTDGNDWVVTLKLIFGIVGIYFGGLWVVGGAQLIATQLGFSEFLISATIIALGTSLPELVVSIMAVIKKNVGLGVGNIIGSNIFNICWVLGIVPLIRPVNIPLGIGFDIGIMFLAMFVLFVFVFLGKHELRRKDGILLVLFYVLYIWFAVTRG